MRPLKCWGGISIVWFGLMFVFSANARITTIAWDSDLAWPAGTTIELEANGTTASGITGNQHTLDVPVQPGETINVRARTIPPAGYQCGEPLGPCPPSEWETLTQTLPKEPAGLWAIRRAGGDIMAIARRGSTNYSVEWQNTSSAVITKESTVQVGDIILIGVSAYSIEGVDVGGTVSISGFTILGGAGTIYATYGGDGASKGTVFYRVVDGTEAASFTINTNANSGNNPYGSAVLIAFSGSSISIEDSGVTDNASGTSPTAPSVTAAGANTMLLSFFLYSDPATFTAPTGSDGSFANSPQNTNGSAISWDAISASGATGTRTATLGTARDCLGVSVLLKETGGGSQALAGAPTAVTTATGAVQMALPVAAASASAATAVGSLSVALPLQAAASIIASATGGVTLQLSMAGAALAEVLSSGALGMTMPLAGDSVVEAAASGDVTTGSETDLSGDVTVGGSATGVLEQATGMVGAAAAEAVGVGTITLSMALAGSVVAEALAAAGVTLGSALATQAAAEASGTGAVGMTTGLIGDAAAEASGSGAAGMTTGLIGGAAAEVTGSADAGMTLPLAGDAAGEVASTGDLTALAEGALAGAATVVPTIVGALGLTTPIAGIASVLATAGGVLGMSIPAAGDAAAVVLSTGNLQVSAGIPLSAVALAAASASGALSITIPMDAVALAQAVVTGALSGGTDTFTPYAGRTWTPGYAPRIWEPLASQRTWVAAANNRTWRR